MKLILASSSKQRREILNNLGLKYEVVKSLVEESSSNTDPCEYVKDLSRDKANSVAGQVKEKAYLCAPYSWMEKYMKNQKIKKKLLKT